MAAAETSDKGQKWCPHPAIYRFCVNCNTFWRVLLVQRCCANSIAGCRRPRNVEYGPKMVSASGNLSLWHQLHRYISWVQGVAQRYEGTLAHLTIGDKGSYLSVVFGAPLAHEDDARRAVAVALQLRTPPAELSFIQTSQIGISLGMMRTGAYGGRMRRTYGVLGDQVNLAARLIAHAKSAQILVSPSAQRAAAPYFTWRALRPIHVKGKSEPISPFEVLAIRLAAVGLHQPTSTLPIVGRQEQFAQLCAKLQLARAKKGQIVGITGEAGIGKSRLVAEVIEFALEQGIAVYGGERQSYATKSPYLVWQPIWGALFGLSPGMSTAQQVKQLQNELARISPSLPPSPPSPPSLAPTSA